MFRKSDVNNERMMPNMCDHMSHSELTEVYYVGQTRHRYIHRYIRDNGEGGQIDRYACLLIMARRGVGV